MLVKDFFFSFKNIQINFLKKKKKIKLLKITFSYIYKFIALDLIIYNFFKKKNLDKISKKNKKLFEKNLNNLFEYFNSYSKYHNYSKFYEENLEEIKNKNNDVLTIGTALGGGVASFYFYLPFSNFIAADNNPFKLMYKSKRIRNMYVDASSKNILKNLTNYLNIKFDLIIEDSSHKLVDQILCFAENFNNLKKGGIYIVEDLNFPEIDNMYNPTNEKTNLKIILEKIHSKETVSTKFIDDNQLKFIQDNVESIKFYKSKNKNNYLISDKCDHSEIAFIKRKNNI